MASDNEKSTVYYVPENYTNGAKLLGFLNPRNAVELLILDGSLAFAEIKLIHCPAMLKVAILCMTVVPLGIFLVMGIDGCSLTEYLQRMFKSVKNKKYMVRKEAYFGVQAEAEFARTEAKIRKRGSKKK